MAAAPTGQYIIEAGWVLAHRDNESVLIPNGSVRVEHDRVAEVSEGRIAGNLPRI